MTTEAPKQVDLNQDLQAQGIQLSPDQQEKYESYLNTLEDAEKQDIIYLTQQELGELKNILDEDDSAQHDADFDEFIKQQREEGLSTADIFGEDSTLPEDLSDEFDVLSHEALFGNEGILNEVELTDQAKDNMSVSLTLSILENIDIGKDYSSISEAFENIHKNLEALQSLIHAQKDIGPHGNQTNILDVAGDGERNYIFMDANIGKNFFTMLLTQENSQDDILQYIHDRNLDATSDTQITNNINGLKIDAEDTLRRLEAVINTPKESNDYPKESDDSSNDSEPIGDINLENVPSPTQLDEMEEKGGLWEMIAKMFKEFIKMFDISKNDDLGNEDTVEDESTNPEETVDIVPEELQANQELIDMIDALSPLNQEHIETLQNNPALTSKIRKIMEGISTNQTFEETFGEVFDSGDILESNGIRAGKIFEEYEFEMSLPAGLNEIEKGIRMLEEYSRYRNSDGVRNLASGRTLWVDWAKMRQAENWRVGGN